MGGEYTTDPFKSDIYCRSILQTWEKTKDSRNQSIDKAISR